MGATLLASIGTTNFALFSTNARSVVLCLFTEGDLRAGRTTHEVQLDPLLNRTGDVWHVALPDLDSSLLYGYRMGGLHQGRDKGAAAAGQRFEESCVVLDPYARAIIGRRSFGQLGPDLKYGQAGVLGAAPTWPQAAATLPAPGPPFDWQGDRPLGLLMEDLIIYEMHVRGFTWGGTAGVRSPGTYLGLVEKLPYLQALGINAIELLPVHEFNELEYYQVIPGSDQFRFNYWGYSTVGFFAPMARYSAAAVGGGGGADVVDEFKTLVRECHKRGIEVILDVVFNHTAEGNEMGPTLSFRGLDNRVYYMLAPEGQYYNYSGCGNTLNCNHPVVRRFIVDCLRYWVLEMHVDGFRFDLGSIFTRAHSQWHDVGAASEDAARDKPGEPLAAANGASMEPAMKPLADLGSSQPSTPPPPPAAPGIMPNAAGSPTGTPLNDPPLVEMISEDPVLQNTKLIAEAWDCDGLNQVGAFPHYGGRWAEWNGTFRDAVRAFVKGTEGPWAAAFASAVAGSPHLYRDAGTPPGDWWGAHGGRRWRGGRGPAHSVNFITAHDGFPLADLVAYNQKHNEANGEGNRDGEQHNLTWNCGAEGLTRAPRVLRLRARQQRNLAAALLLAQGVPMVLMGDEYGHSKGGNNNTYCHDSPLNWFNWDLASDESNGFARFFRALVRFRQRHPELRRGYYGGLDFHGAAPGAPDFGEASRLVAWSLGDGAGGGLYIAFNASHRAQVVELPHWPGRAWRLVADTSKEPPYDWLEDDGALTAAQMADVHAAAAAWLDDGLYALLPYSSLLLTSVSAPPWQEPAAQQPLPRSAAAARTRPAPATAPAGNPTERPRASAPPDRPAQPARASGAGSPAAAPQHPVLSAARTLAARIAGQRAPQESGAGLAHPHIVARPSLSPSSTLPAGTARVVACSGGFYNRAPRWSRRRCY
ncbi:hypothetical protein WJX81_003335 [Elliptochloris bilobata]|uniref:Glycosyl hydrolase family 13 catalytic domain-containing protein n=1 Tax=Elliptochloris bilobata TaxID=381761 RepID=A0AAW1SDH8_9CHLO